MLHLVPVHPDCPRQSPESHKMVIIIVVVVVVVVVVVPVSPGSLKNDHKMACVCLHVARMYGYLTTVRQISLQWKKSRFQTQHISILFNYV